MSLSKLFMGMLGLGSAGRGESDGSNPASSASTRAAGMWQSMASSKRNNRSRSPRRGQNERVKVGSPGLKSKPLESFDSVEQIFSLEKHMIASVQKELGEDACAKAFMKLQDSVVATTFSGCGFTEISLMALAAAAGSSIAWGPCLDWDKPCQTVLSALHPTRCCFGDIADVRNLKRAWCYTHEKKCAPGIPKLSNQNGFRIEVAGPCCPPWSAFGKGLGAQDERYKSHKDWQAKVKKDKPDIIVFENVERYDKTLLVKCFGKLYGIKVSKLDPPLLWQVPMARPRWYFILYLKETCRWVGPEDEDWGTGMAAVKIPPQDEKLDFRILAKAVNRTDNALAKRPLTSSEEKHLKIYREAVREGDLRATDAWDLHQNGRRRPCTERVDGSLMTLRRNCGSIWVDSLKKLLTPRQLMRMMGWPMTEKDREALMLPDVRMPDSISDTQLCSMAGNGMFGPCSALTIFAAMLYVERIP